LANRGHQLPVMISIFISIIISKSNLKENLKTLQEITRMEKDYLIEQNFLKMVRGQYPDLVITSKKKKGKNKKYYVTDYLAMRVKEMYK